MTTGLICGIVIYLIGYILCFWLCVKKWGQRLFDASVISVASWGIALLYLVHVLYNYFHKEEE